MFVMGRKFSTFCKDTASMPPCGIGGEQDFPVTCACRMSVEGFISDNLRMKERSFKGKKRYSILFQYDDKIVKKLPSNFTSSLSVKSSR
jgi:hypothetical protein